MPDLNESTRLIGTFGPVCRWKVVRDADPSSELSRLTDRVVSELSQEFHQVGIIPLKASNDTVTMDYHVPLPDNQGERWFRLSVALRIAQPTVNATDTWMDVQP